MSASTGSDALRAVAAYVRASKDLTAWSGPRSRSSQRLWNEATRRGHRQDELPISGEFPFLHLQQSFMHLGFHIYDVGFQSPDSEAARPLVWCTTLLLICIVVMLNAAAMSI